MNCISIAAAASVCCLLFASEPRAQQSTESTTQPPPDAIGSRLHVREDIQLQEIQVTAQRRSENLQKVPIAVSAITEEQLQATGIDNTAVLTSVTPALTFTKASGLAQFHIRGIGNLAQGAGIENSVATYVDGVYIASVPGSLLNFSNVERVEVLRGPQGTLFGRNATGGLVQIVTKDPGGQFSGNATIEYGNYETVGMNAYVTGPIAPNLDADMMLSATHQGSGYGQNLDTGNDMYRTDRDLAARSKWLFNVGGTTVRLSLDFQQRFSTDPTPTLLSGTPPGGSNVPIYTRPWDAYMNEDPLQHVTGGGAALRIDQELGPLVLTSISAVRDTTFLDIYDGDFTSLPKTLENYTQKDHQFSQELQLTSKSSGRLQWIIGAYYFHLNSKYDPFSLFFGAPGSNSYLQYRDTSLTESLAGFGQATFTILPETNLTAGVRYTEDKRSLSGISSAVSVAGVETDAPITRPQVTTHVPTWRIALDHSFTPDVFGYLSYDRGYKSGGYTAQSPAAPAYAPEYLDAYQIGEKAQFFDNRIRVNSELFLYNYKDIQVNTVQGSVGITYNGARARLYGFDSDIEYRVTDPLTITAGIDLLHTEFTSFPNAVVATPIGDGAVRLGLGSATGNELPFAPSASISLGFDYKMNVGNGSADLVINDLHRTGFFAQVDNYLTQSASDMLNGSLTWKPASKSYSVQLWANNMLDKTIAEYLAVSTVGQLVSYQAPRTFGVRFGVEF